MWTRWFNFVRITTRILDFHFGRFCSIFWWFAMILPGLLCGLTQRVVKIVICQLDWLVGKERLHHFWMDFWGSFYYSVVLATRFLCRWCSTCVFVMDFSRGTMMMKRAWRDLGSNLEKFSYLHSDLSSNDVLLVIFSMDHTHRTL